MVSASIEKKTKKKTTYIALTIMSFIVTFRIGKNDEHYVGHFGTAFCTR